MNVWITSKLREGFMQLWQGGGEQWFSSPPLEIWKLRLNYLNNYNRIYQHNIKNNFVLKYVQNFMKMYKTLVSGPMCACTCCTQWHFPLPGKSPIWNTLLGYPNHFKCFFLKATGQFFVACSTKAEVVGTCTCKISNLGVGQLRFDGRSNMTKTGVSLFKSKRAEDTGFWQALLVWLFCSPVEFHSEQLLFSHSRSTS